MPALTQTVTITLPDGSTATHTAEALGYRHFADGSIGVLGACCGAVGGTLCTCNGTGVIPAPAPAASSSAISSIPNGPLEIICPDCGGRGITGGTVCPECKGARTIDGAPCPACNGRGEIRTEDTRSWHTFYDIGMPTSNGSAVQPPIDPVQEVTQHIQNVAARHAARHKAKATSLDSLVRPRPVAGGS